MTSTIAERCRELEDASDAPAVIAQRDAEAARLAARRAPPPQPRRRIDRSRHALSAHASTPYNAVLSELALGGVGLAPTAGGGVKVASLHRTKGLQWPRVYIVGLEQGMLPDYRTETEAELSEERRACFVGVCRAETHLTLTRIRQFRGFRKPPSIFLKEMDIDTRG